MRYIQMKCPDEIPADIHSPNVERAHAIQRYNISRSSSPTSTSVDRDIPNENGIVPYEELEIIPTSSSQPVGRLSKRGLDILDRLKLNINNFQIVKCSSPWDITKNKEVKGILYADKNYQKIWTVSPKHYREALFLEDDEDIKLEISLKQCSSNKNIYYANELHLCQICRQSIMIAIDCCRNEKAVLFDTSIGTMLRREVRAFLINNTLKLAHTSCLWRKLKLSEDNSKCSNFLFKIFYEDKPISELLEYEKNFRNFGIKLFYIIILTLVIGLMITTYINFKTTSWIAIATVYWVGVCLLGYYITKYYFCYNKWRQNNKNITMVVWQPIFRRDISLDTPIDILEIR